ncbi:hypothetical protein [Pseudomonas caspiana]|uniref:hypothetical protein n=1 Tax=Pseudomonas caspiana TaxID=1451454 RepID=UPI0032EACB8D
MIQRPASGTFDLEFGVLAHSGKKSFAFPTSAIFQHLPMPFIYAGARRLNPQSSAGFALQRKSPENGALQ